MSTKKQPDSISKKIKDRVSECAKEANGILFSVEWNQEQREYLAALAHENSDFPNYGKLLHIDCSYHSKEVVQKDINNLLDNNFKTEKTILVTKKIQEKIEGIIISDDGDKSYYTTLFFDKVTDYDRRLLQGFVKLARYKEKHESGTIKNKPMEYLKKLEDGQRSWVENVKEVGDGLYNATHMWIFKPLIIIYSPEELPDSFKKEFEVILLSPEPRAENGQKVEIVPFATPQNAKWSDVEITFIDKENVKIIVKNKTEHFHFSAIGFKDARKKPSTPDRAWNRLAIFALKDGTITYEFNENTLKNTDYYIKPKDIESINEKLRLLFDNKIPNNPIPPYNRKEKCYKIGLKHIGTSSNYQKHIESILLKTGSQKDDEGISEEGYFQQAKDNSYSSSPFSDKLEDDPQYQDDN